MDYLLEKWDAIELFCRLVSKKEGIPIKDFQNNNCLNRWLKAYTHKPLCEDLTNAIVDEMNKKNVAQKTKAGERLNKHVRFIYDLCHDIRYSNPVVIDVVPFEAALKYIGNKEYSSHKRNKLELFSSNNKQRLLEGTKWWIYFFDEIAVGKGEKQRIKPGISRGILELKPFTRVTITRSVDQTDTLRVFEGFFQLKGDSQYLAIKAQLKKSDERDLRLLFYIGSEGRELAIGISARVSETLWARTVMIEPIDPKSTDHYKKIGFLYRDDTKPNEIHDHVWEYFANKQQNKLEIPSGITTVAKFWRWKNKTNG